MARVTSAMLAVQPVLFEVYMCQLWLFFMSEHQMNNLRIPRVWQVRRAVGPDPRNLLGTTALCGCSNSAALPFWCGFHGEIDNLQGIDNLEGKPPPRIILI